MPHRLKQRQYKIQEKRKQTPWREFVMEICSWYPMNLYKYNGSISRYPQTGREGSVVTTASDSLENGLVHTMQGSFWEDMQTFFNASDKSATLSFGNNENSDYTDGSYGVKSCYLSFNLGLGVSSGLYSCYVLQNCDTIIGSVYVSNNSNNIFESQAITNSFNVFYSKNIHDSSEIWFSINMVGCHDCLFCDGLNNKKYCISNKQLSKEEYMIQKKRILQDKDQFSSVADKIRSGESKVQAAHSSGDNISYADFVQDVFFASRVKDSKNVILFDGGSEGSYNFYDGIDVGINSHDLYGVCQAGTDAHDIYCSLFGGQGNNVYYSMNFYRCDHCFGCIGLKNKSYCIFNKQYTKEDRYEKVDEIFTEMEKDGTLGNFFPGSMNPFYFNDTAAYLIDDSFTKEEVEAKGYLWRDEPITVDIPEGVQTVSVDELGKYEGWSSPHLNSGQAGSDGQKTIVNLQDSSLSSEGQERWIDPEIMKKVIVDDAGNAYRVIPMEYEFLMKHGLPLPRKYWLKRIKQHFSLGNIS